MGEGKGVPLIYIKDGWSNTILVGEKHVPPDKFGVGGWDCSMYNGDMVVCSARSGGPAFPMAESIQDPGWKFGSYHPPNICQFAFVDGSVRRIWANIDPNVFYLLCNIADGQVIPPYE